MNVIVIPAHVPRTGHGDLRVNLLSQPFRKAAGEQDLGAFAGEPLRHDGRAATEGEPVAVLLLGLGHESLEEGIIGYESPAEERAIKRHATFLNWDAYSAAAPARKK